MSAKHSKDIAHMNPTTAAALIMEATNSASPKALTPQRLIPKTETRKIVVARGGGIVSVSFQYVRTLSAAMISRGTMVSQFMA